jgi:TolB-like protein
VAAGVTLLVTRVGRPARPPPGQSIAVLPFADLSPNKDQEYFADGVAEEILNALAHVDGLRVAGRTSSFYFKGKNVKLKEVGRELNVAAVLEGSVRREGNQVRIKAQVVDVADGLLRWSETFDREATGVFAVQDEIARAVVDALQVRLRPGRSPLPPLRRTTSPEAYGKVLLGRQFHNRGTLEGFRLAAQAHERAIAIDPEYAPAWSGLAIGLAMLWNTAGNEALTGVPDVRRRAMAAAEKAVALDPELADGWAVRATLRAMTWNWAGAEADIRRAQEIDPGDVRGLRTMGWLLASHGRLEEAVAVEQKADQLDPLNPWGWWNLARFALGLGRNDLAQDALKRSAEIAPDERAGGRPVELVAALLRGAPAEALALAEGAGEEPFRLWGQALAQHTLGHARESDAARKALEVRYGNLLAYPVAQVHAWRGEKDGAFEWLERSFERRDISLEGIAFDPLLRQLHGDPRYAGLLKRMNLPAR